MTGRFGAQIAFEMKGIGTAYRTCDDGSHPRRFSLTDLVRYMSTAPKSYLSTTQYLAQERKAEFKSPYSRGEVFAMAGASREHNLIVGNLVREIGNALKNR